MYTGCSNFLRLEGSPPGMKMAGGVPGFSTPQLPRPGQKVAKKNALKIEKYVTDCILHMCTYMYIYVHVRTCVCTQRILLKATCSLDIVPIAYT